MKDFFQFLSFIPQYLADFGSLLVGPKRFIAKKNLTTKKALSDALRFSGISLGLLLILSTVLRPPGSDILAPLVIYAIYFVAITALNTLFMRLAWRLVGGKASLRILFLTCTYQCAVLVLMVGFFQIISLAVLKSYDPVIAQQVFEGGFWNKALMRLPLPIIIFSAFFAMIGTLFSVIWPIAFWGAFRKINGVTKLRSVFAAVVLLPISLVLGLPIWIAGTSVLGKWGPLM